MKSSLQFFEQCICSAQNVLYLSFHKLLDVKGNAVSFFFVQAQLYFAFDGAVPAIFHRIVCSRIEKNQLLKQVVILFCPTTLKE